MITASNLPGKAYNRNSEECTEKTVTRKQSRWDNQSFIETLRNVNSAAYNFLHLDKKNGTTYCSAAQRNNLTNTYLFKVTYTSTRKRCEIYVKVNNKNTRTTSTLFWCFYRYLWTHLAPFSSASIVNFEQVNISWLLFRRATQ